MIATHSFLPCCLILLSFSGFAYSTDAKSGWSDWLEWTSCSVTCGYGTYFRLSYWINEKGEKTNVTLKENAACFKDIKCPVNGNWTMWSPWSYCTSMCGPGTWTRTRGCANPTPANGGLDCVGSKTESDNCLLDVCPKIPKNFNINDCTEKDFMCESQRQCVPAANRCDKKLQCHDGSDEKSCTLRYTHNSKNSVYQVSSSIIFLCLIMYKCLTNSWKVH